jgi:hypothetical protein
MVERRRHALPAAPRKVEPVLEAQHLVNVLERDDLGGVRGLEGAGRTQALARATCGPIIGAADVNAKFGSQMLLNVPHLFAQLRRRLGLL